MLRTTQIFCGKLQSLSDSIAERILSVSGLITVGVKRHLGFPHTLFGTKCPARRTSCFLLIEPPVTITAAAQAQAVTGQLW